jgi:hypothetical protein
MQQISIYLHKWFSKNFISLWKSGCYTPLASCPSQSPGHHRVHAKSKPPPLSPPPISMSSTRATSPTLTGPRLTFPLLPRHCRGSPPPSRVTRGRRRRRSAATPPVFAAHRWPAATVSLRPPILSLRVILSMLILMPPELENLLTRVTVGRHAVARALCCVGQCGPHKPIWPLHQAAPLPPWDNSDPSLFPTWNFFSKLKCSRNAYNLLEFIENKLKLRKIWNEFI